MTQDADLTIAIDYLKNLALRACPEQSWNNLQQMEHTQQTKVVDKNMLLENNIQSLIVHGLRGSLCCTHQLWNVVQKSKLDKKHIQSKFTNGERSTCNKCQIWAIWVRHQFWVCQKEVTARVISGKDWHISMVGTALFAAHCRFFCEDKQWRVVDWKWEMHCACSERVQCSFACVTTTLCITFSETWPTTDCAWPLKFDICCTICILCACHMHLHLRCVTKHFNLALCTACFSFWLLAPVGFNAHFCASSGPLVKLWWSTWFCSFVLDFTLLSQMQKMAKML